MAISPPVTYRPDLETIVEDEAETVEKLNAVFDQILEKTSKDYGHAVRAVHAKSHGVLEGKLTIKEGLPPELRQGLFAALGEYKIHMRFSTNAGDILPDDVSLPRGVSIKVVGVSGERLEGAQGDTQDFVLVDTSVFQAKNTKTFLKKLKPIAKTTDRMEQTKIVVSRVLRTINRFFARMGRKSTQLASMGGTPNTQPLGQTYFSVTPFRYGIHIAKFSLAPASPDLQNLAEVEIDARGKPDAVRDRVRQDMQKISAFWDLRVQLCRDLFAQPIEDPTTEWKEKDTPFETVARISVAPQDSWSPQSIKKIDEAMRFSVWTGLEAHRPLGEINRARKATYQHSADFRARFNQCPLHEPKA